MAFSITPSASRRIAEILSKENLNGGFFRVEVRGGGCQGFEYVFGVGAEKAQDDHRFGDEAAPVVIDSVSLPFLLGATLDWIETVSEERFVFDNPNVQSACGCGVSFSL